MKFAVYSTNAGWLQDTCAGGLYSWDTDDAVWFTSEQEAFAALVGADIIKALDLLPSHLLILRVK